MSSIVKVDSRSLQPPRNSAMWFVLWIASLATKWLNFAVPSSSRVDGGGVNVEGHAQFGIRIPHILHGPYKLSWDAIGVPRNVLVELYPLTRRTGAWSGRGRGPAISSPLHKQFIFLTTTSLNNLRLKCIMYWYLLSNPACFNSVALLTTFATC